MNKLNLAWQRICLSSVIIIMILIGSAVWAKTPNAILTHPFVLNQSGITDNNVESIILSANWLDNKREYQITHHSLIKRIIEGIKNCVRRDGGPPLQIKAEAHFKFYLRSGNVVSIPFGIADVHKGTIAYVMNKEMRPDEDFAAVMSLLLDRLFWSNLRSDNGRATGLGAGEVFSLYADILKHRVSTPTKRCLLIVSLYDDMLEDLKGHQIQTESDRVRLWDIYCRKARFLEEAGKYDEAIQTLRSAKVVFKKQNSLFKSSDGRNITQWKTWVSYCTEFSIGKINANKKKDYQKAIEAYKEALKFALTNESNGQSYVLGARLGLPKRIANCYRQMGEYALAAKEYQRIYDFWSKEDRIVRMAEKKRVQIRDEWISDTQHLIQVELPKIIEECKAKAK